MYGSKIDVNSEVNLAPSCIPAGIARSENHICTGSKHIFVWNSGCSDSKANTGTCGPCLTCCSQGAYCEGVRGFLGSHRAYSIQARGTTGGCEKDVVSSENLNVVHIVGGR